MIKDNPMQQCFICSLDCILMYFMVAKYSQSFYYFLNLFIGPAKKEQRKNTIL